MTDSDSEKAKGSGNGVLLAVIGLLSAVSVAAISNWDKIFSNPVPTPTPTITNTLVPSPVVKITQPTDGSQVPIEKNFAGTFSNLPENASLWLYVYPTDEHKYYLREIVDRRNDGTWQLIKVAFGTSANIGTTYRVGVLVADIESTMSLRSNSQGLSQLPNQKKYSELSINKQ